MGETRFPILENTTNNQNFQLNKRFQASNFENTKHQLGQVQMLQIQAITNKMAPTVSESFFLPSENSESPPVPTNPEVFTDRMQPSEFYVKSFSPKSGDYSYFEDAKKEMVGEMQAQGLKLKED